MAAPHLYYAVVDLNGEYPRNWTADSSRVVCSLYQHAESKLLICHASPSDKTDCSIVATIEPQLMLEAATHTPLPSS